MILNFWLITVFLCILGIKADDVIFTIGGKKLRKNNIILRSLEIICLILTWLVISSNIIGVDIINYNNWYIRSEVVIGREMLYALLRNTFKTITRSTFFIFRAVMTALFGLFPIAFLRKSQINICFVLLIYNLSLVFFDSMQFRNSIALFVLIFLTGILLTPNATFKHKLIFIVGILLISQIHTMFLIYLLFVPLMSPKKITYAKIIFVVSFLVMIATKLNGDRVPGIGLLYSLFLSNSDNRVYSDAGGNLIFIIPTALHMFTTVLLIYLKRRAHSKLSKLNRFEDDYINFTISIDICFFFVVSLIIMNTTFYRIIRNLFPLNIIAIYMLYRNTESKTKKLFMVLGLIIISVGWLIFKTKIYSTVEIIVDPVLKYGDLFYLH